MATISSTVTRAVLTAVCLAPTWGFSAEIDVSFGSAQVLPLNPTTSSLIQLEFSAGGCSSVYPFAVQVDTVAKFARVSYRPDVIDLHAPCESASTHTIPVGYFPQPGGYEISVYRYSFDPLADPFDPEYFDGSVVINITEPSPLAHHEVPADGSMQSGVGMIRGWACDAKGVQVFIDDIEFTKLAYGATRADTQEVCGDENNGYSAVVAWGLLGAGPHSMRVYKDGFFIEAVDFEVSGLDDPFIEGLSGTYELEDFPSPGESVIVEWSEPDQNFIIVEHNQ